MKDQINRLARGEFVYDSPQITMSETDIEFNIAENDYHNGTFRLRASGDVKGIVYSTCSRVTVTEEGFMGTDIEIKYVTDSTGLVTGDSIMGIFNIVSSAGEYSMPYRFKISDRSMDSSIGKIHNIFHFANLAQTEFEEARNLFYSNDFADIFLKRDISLNSIYKTLVKSQDTDTAVEEFLIAVHKKNPVLIQLSEDKKVFDHITENYQDTLYLTKSTWGYTKLAISSDSPWLIPSEDEVTSDQFAGNRFSLEYLMCREKMHRGKNIGKISIRSFHETVECIVICYNHRTDSEHFQLHHEKNLEIKKAKFMLAREYIKFRTKRTDIRHWCENCDGILEKVRGIDDSSDYLKLAHAQIYFIMQREEEGLWLLDNVKDNAMQLRNADPLLYGYYLYVNSLEKRTAEYSREVHEIMKKYYDNGNDEWQLLWFMFYVSDEYDKNRSIKLARIKEQFHNGCTSPVMYLEACNIMNAQPQLLRVLNEFELQVLNFGCKYEVLNERAALQACDIIDGMKVADKHSLRLLQKLYQIVQSDDILNVLCAQLIKNELVGRKYFKIYERSILRNLRITRLYEFYMECADLTDMRQLPRMVLMYFSYENQLPYELKSYLYANVVHNKEQDIDSYNNYQRHIKKFALEQMRLNHINDNLAVVYKDIWESSIINQDTAAFMGQLLFTYKIHVFDKNIKAVIVKHKEYVEEEIVSIDKNGTAFVRMYTDNTAVVFEDCFGQRRKDSIRYEIEKVFEDMAFVEDIYQVNSACIHLNLYFCESNIKYHRNRLEDIKIITTLLQNHKVDKLFRDELIGILINYYYSEYPGDKFKFYFLDIDKENLSEENSVKLIEACVINGMYEDAYDLVLIYGFEKVNAKRLFRMVRHMIEIMNYKTDKFIMSICEHVFLHKKYDDIILLYLVKGFNGSNEQMLLVWQSCANFHVDSFELQERIIVQLMFTYGETSVLSKVFDMYYEKGPKERIVEAFLAYNSYLYFVKEENIADSIFRIIESRLKYDYDMIDICKLALLKFYSGQKELSETERPLASELLYKMCRNDLIFLFYKGLLGKVSMPYQILDKTIVEYRTNPNKKVVINYILNGTSSDKVYIRQNMKNIYQGIFTKEFTLFYGDNLQYYISETDGSNTVDTELFHILSDNLNPLSTEGRFDYINDMLASKELHDMITLTKLMNGYSVEDYVTEQIFKPQL